MSLLREQAVRLQANVPIAFSKLHLDHVLEQPDILFTYN